jgi:hypothetical protein
LIPLPVRSKRFLAALLVLAGATTLSGAWEFYLSRAVHELFLGVLMLLLVGLGRIVWARSTG